MLQVAKFGDSFHLLLLTLLHIDFVPRQGPNAFRPSLVSEPQIIGFLRHGFGKVVQFTAILAQIVQFPRGIVNGDQLMVSLADRPVALVLPVKSTLRHGILGKDGQEALAFHSLDRKTGCRETGGSEVDDVAWRMPQLALPLTVSVCGSALADIAGKVIFHKRSLFASALWV